MGDCFRSIFKEAYRRNPGISALLLLTTDNGIRVLQVLVWACIMLPLIVPRHINSLRYACTFAVTMMVYFVTVIIIHSALNGLPEHRHNVRVSAKRDVTNEGPYIYLFRNGKCPISGLRTEHVSQVNALEVFVDMQPRYRNTFHFTLAASVATGICSLLYLLTLVFAYFDFGAKRLQGSSIVLMYNPLAEPYTIVAYCGVLFKLCVSYAPLSLAARNAIYYVLGFQMRYRTKAVAYHRDDKDDAQAEPGHLPGDSYPTSPLGKKHAADEGFSSKKVAALQPAAAAAASAPKAPLAPPEHDDHDESYIDNIPMPSHLIVVGIPTVIIVVCGLFVSNIELAFGSTGSICGSFLGFIFPPFSSSTPADSRAPRLATASTSPRRCSSSQAPPRSSLSQAEQSTGPPEAPSG